jgi:hypothetical protein
MQGLRISPGVLPAECEALRTEVRAFLAEQMAGMPVARRATGRARIPSSRERWPRAAGSA